MLAWFNQLKFFIISCKYIFFLKAHKTWPATTPFSFHTSLAPTQRKRDHKFWQSHGIPYAALSKSKVHLHLSFISLSFSSLFTEYKSFLLHWSSFAIHYPLQILLLLLLLPLLHHQTTSPSNNISFAQGAFWSLILRFVCFTWYFGWIFVLTCCFWLLDP